MEARRQDKSCLQLFVGALPHFTPRQLMALAFTVLVASSRAIAAEPPKPTFFAHRVSHARLMKNPCIQASPGFHLTVTPPTVEGSEYYTVGQYSSYGNMDLEKQLEDNVFVGDVFCNGKLQAIKGARTESLRGKNFANSDYTVDFSDPMKIDVSVHEKEAEKAEPSSPRP